MMMTQEQIEFRFERTTISRGEVIVLGRDGDAALGYSVFDECPVLMRDSHVVFIENPEDSMGRILAPLGVGSAARMFELHQQILAAGEGEWGGYRYLAHWPHVKGFLWDVTPHCDKEWLEEMGVERIEERHIYDSARRVHIASLTPSIEGWAIDHIVTMQGDPCEDAEVEHKRDQVEGELRFEHRIDYFPHTLTPAYEGEPATDGEVRDLVFGELSYDDFMESHVEYHRANEKF